MRMTIRITGVFDEPFRNEDGSWSFDIPGRLPTPEESRVLDALFPDLESSVGQLLAKQAVFNAIR